MPYPETDKIKYEFLFIITLLFIFKYLLLLLMPHENLCDKVHKQHVPIKSSAVGKRVMCNFLPPDLPRNFLAVSLMNH